MDFRNQLKNIFDLCSKVAIAIKERNRGISDGNQKFYRRIKISVRTWR